MAISDKSHSMSALRFVLVLNPLHLNLLYDGTRLVLRKHCTKSPKKVV